MVNKLMSIDNNIEIHPKKLYLYNPEKLEKKKKYNERRIS